MGIIKTGKIQSHGDIVGVETRITTLEDKYVRFLWFAEISSGTSGTITPPTGGTIVLDQWAAGVDAVTSTLTTTRNPTFESVKNSAGVIITATLAANGAWTFSDTPSAYPIAILYVYDVKLISADRTKCLVELETNQGLKTTDTPTFAALNTIGKITVNANSSSLPADIIPTGSDLLRIGGTDAKDAGIVLDAFGTGVNTRIYGRLARGTALNKTAIQTDDNIIIIEAQGYDGSAYSSDYAALWSIKAAENWTGSAQGTYQHFEITIPGSLTKQTVLDLRATGAIIRMNSNSARGMSIVNVNTGDSTYSSIYFGDSVSETTAIMGLVGSGTTSYGGARSLFLGTNIDTPIVFIKNGIEAARIDTDGELKIVAEKITAGTGTVNSVGHVNRQVYKVTTAYTAFADTDTTKGIVIATLPAKTKLVGCYADTTTKYIGGAVTAATLEVGVTAEGAAEIIAAHDVFTAAVTKGLADADMGTAMTRAAQIQSGYLPSWSGTTAVYATIDTTTANTNALTQGSTTFYLVTERF